MVEFLTMQITMNQAKFGKIYVNELFGIKLIFNYCTLVLSNSDSCFINS